MSGFLTKKYRVLFVAFILTCCMIFFVAITVRAMYSGNTPAKFFANQDKVSASWEESESYESSSQREVWYHTYYTKCTHDYYTPREQGNAGLSGLERKQIEEMFLAYTVEEYTNEKIVLSHFIEDFCRECHRYVFIGIKDDRVAIFYGKAREDAPVKSVTSIEIEFLPQNQVEQLRGGITVDNIAEEINTILEGLQG